MIKRLLFAFVVWVTVATIGAYYGVLRPMQRNWGVDPEEQQRDLPGDEVVPDASIVETRGITINAPPSAVWPWLIQMGYGRAGWYSYDRYDNNASSARSVLPQFQNLAVGDVMPMQPQGGFRVDKIDPEHSLVLYLDNALVEAQAKAWQGPKADVQASLKTAGAMGSMTMPEFKVSWAFVVEPSGEDATRLIERFRVNTPLSGPAQRLGMPFMGLGVFLMSRKQMLGIKERVEAGPQTEALAA
jgi:hypothetical protein